MNKILVSKTRVAKAKRPKSTITKSKKAKEVIDFTGKFSDDFFRIRKTPYSDASLDRLARQMIAWVLHSPDNVVFQEFLVMKQMQYKVLADFMRRSESLRAAKEFAMMVIGVNREKGAIFKRLDGNVIKQMQHRYDPEWKEAEKYHNDLKIQVAESEVPDTVIIEKFRSKKGELK